MDRRGFLRVSLTALSGLAAFFASIPFIRSFLPSAKARALAEPIAVDLSKIPPGDVRPYSYRGETMLVLHRTPDMLEALAATDDRLLGTNDPAYADPSYVDPRHRGVNRDYLVVKGVCSHLGCIPRKTGEQGKKIAGDWWRGGFICPCQQSGFDYAGRVVRRPAPRDLPIPPHRYAGPTTLVIGEDAKPS
jgi:ubiquinol-cytochrome c reductase iron-sulfur subunit